MNSLIHFQSTTQLMAYGILEIQNTKTNIDIASVSNLKQIWSINGNNVNWINYHARFNKLLLRKSSQVKNIWIPYGE